MGQEATDDDLAVFIDLKDALNSLKAHRPNDRTEKDRAYAICITDTEKALAYFDVFILGVWHNTPQTPKV